MFRVAQVYRASDFAVCRKFFFLVPKRFARLSSAEFAAVYAQGKPLRHPLLQMRVLRRGDGSETVGVAFAVGKKLGKATVRNQMRRRMRAAFQAETRAASTRESEKRAPFSGEEQENAAREYSRREISRGQGSPLDKLRGANVIFLASPPALDADFTALCAALRELAERLRDGTSR